MNTQAVDFHSPRGGTRRRIPFEVLITAALAVAGLALFPPQRAHAQVEVGQWGRFEAAVTNPTRYADPYADVTLDVTYTRPDGAAVDFWGFYDGDGTWRIRFMPDRLGTWRYDARFSDGQPGASGSFEVVPSDLPGLIHKDEQNPMWFGFKGGGHVLIRSFHGGPPLLAFDFGEAERDAFLDWAQGQGYNMLSVNDFQEDVGGTSWDIPDLWPLDAAEYRQIERVLDELARRRILFYSFGGLFPRDEHPTDSADQSRLIRYYLARLGPYWNVVLNLSGDEADDFLDFNTINRLGAEVADADVFGHLLAVHNNDVERYRNDVYPFRDRRWNSYVTLHGLETYDLAVKAATLRKQHTGQQPVYAQETIWVGNTLQADGFSLTDLRKGMWVHMMSAAAFNNGDMNGRNASGFSGSLDLDDKVQARHDIPKMIWDFMETVPFYRMAPRQDLVTAGFCLAEPGAEYLVYLPEGGQTSVAVEGEQTYEVAWVNARDPADRRVQGQTADGQNLTAPDTQDWVLHLTAVRAPAAFTVDRAEGPAPLAVRFDASASGAPEGVSITGYAWDFGDGSAGVGRVVSHTYAEPGTYTATLTISYSDGGTAIALQQIEVHAATGATAKLSIAGVSASSDDGDGPANVLDGDLSTRWSALGVGEWIAFELSGTATVESLKIAWYRGNRRSTSFRVEASQDGATWATLYEGASSGATAGLETYDVADAAARHVRVVGLGNSANDWNSITELEIYGTSSGDPGDPDPGDPDPGDPTYVWLEAEAGSPTTPLRVRSDGAASGGRYIETPRGRASNDAPPTNGRASYPFTVTREGTYRVWGRVIAADTGSDSFWIRMDGGDWVRWNEIEPGGSWHWDAVHDADGGNAVVDFALSAGAHTLEVAYREREARLDKLLVTDDLAYVPSGTGEPRPTSAEARQAPETVRLEGNYPNPFNPQTTIRYALPEASRVKLEVFDAAGRRVAVLANERQGAGTHEAVFEAAHLPSGTYLYRLQAGPSARVGKMVLVK